MNDVKLLPLPEWTKRDDLGNLVPSEVRVAVQVYARACIEDDRKARADGGEAVAEVPSGHPTSIVHWLKPLPSAGTKLYTRPPPDDAARLVGGKPTVPGIYAVWGFHYGHPADHAIVEVIERDGELLTNLHEVNSDRHSWGRVSESSDKFHWSRISAPFTAAQQDNEP